MSDKGAIVMRERCHATVSKRWAKEPRRCKFTSLRGPYCWQHMKQFRNFRIKKSNKHDGYGLFTTEDIPANKMICGYEGDRVVTHDNIKNPFMLKIKKRPPTYIDASKTNIKQEGRWVKDPPGPNNAEIVLQNGKAYLYSIKDIPANTEITAAHKIAEEPKAEPEPIPKRRILKKPTHRLLPRRKPQTKTRQEIIDERYQKKLIIRLQFIRKLFHDSNFAKQLGIKVNPKKTITIPKQDDSTIDQYHKRLEKKVKEQEKALMNYINKNPQAKVDHIKVIDMIDALIKKKKPKLQEE